MVKKNLSTDQRTAIFHFLLEGSKDGKAEYGRVAAAMVKFQTSRRTVARLWASARLQMKEGSVVKMESKKIHPKRQLKHHCPQEFIATIPILERGTIRKIAAACKVSVSTVFKWICLGLIKSHTSALKPDLTAPNKLLRVRFSLDAIRFDRITNTMKFRAMDNIIHIDEKWFFISKKSHRMYLAPNELEPHRTCKNKGFIPKMMFMCAVSRPLFARNGEVLFDGKIGIFPFAKKVAAIRGSKKRPKGTRETKPIDSITKREIRDCLVNQIIPAIKAKWPPHAPKTIFIQQDNAKPHLRDDDPEFRAAASSDGFNIHLIQQPPNSPDCNVNDLGFFRAIQGIQNEYACSNADELIEAVTESFEKLSAQTLNNVFLSLQGCMVEIMKVKGQNRYKTPHMKKAALIRQNNLPRSLEVPIDVVTECIKHLIDEGDLMDIELIMYRLGFHSD